MKIKVECHIAKSAHYYFDVDDKYKDALKDGEYDVDLWDELIDGLYKRCENMLSLAEKDIDYIAIDDVNEVNEGEEK